MIKKLLVEKEMIEVEARDNKYDVTTIDGITTLVFDISHKVIENGNRIYNITNSVVVVKFNPNKIPSRILKSYLYIVSLSRQ